jgi:hypothetical protein
MTTTHRNHPRRRARLGLGAAVTALLTVMGACTVEVDGDACLELADGRATFRVEPCAS